MQPQQLVILQGTTWGISWPITNPAGDPLDITGWTIHGQVRPDVRSDVVLHQWSTELGNAFASAGAVILTVEPAQSSAWLWTTGAYDVELTDPGGRVARIAEGRIRVRPEVTRV